jgi:molybdopterin-containing oxidoreductase family membrane subunit
MTEIFMSWYSGNLFEQGVTFANRMKGPYSPFFWALILCNVIVPQFLWSKKIRLTLPILFVISIVVNIGMWLERFVIVVTSLHLDFLPSAWDMYYPTFWDWSTYIGTIGLFLSLLFLFVRVLPMISIFEMRELVEVTDRREEGNGH